VLRKEVEPVWSKHEEKRLCILLRVRETFLLAKAKQTSGGATGEGETTVANVCCCTGGRFDKRTHIGTQQIFVGELTHFSF
jgi:hypothetical protein